MTPTDLANIEAAFRQWWKIHGHPTAAPSQHAIATATEFARYWVEQLRREAQP